MTDSEESNRQDPRLHDALAAYLAAQAEVLRLAKSSGAPVHDQAVSPGALSLKRTTEPMAGIRAARSLHKAARRVTADYVRLARAEGICWRDVGEALALDSPDLPDGAGYYLAAAAYEHAAGKPDLLREPVYQFDCGSCWMPIADYGPYQSDPRDNERGHAQDCQRFRAQISAWRARLASAL